MKKKTALVTGITGQDGSYLAELLLEQGYRVIGMTRRTSTEVHERIEHVVDRVEIVSGDLLDQGSMAMLIADLRPDEVYNLAAQSFVPTSWNQPVLTGEFTALGVTRLLEAIRSVDPKIRFYQASSSEMFGKAQETPQRETTPFYPRSPYGIAKVYGHWITVNYRESYDMFAVSGILFNHESVPGSTPVIAREGGLITIKPLDEIMCVRETGPNVQHAAITAMEVWDGDAFVRVLGASAYKHRPVVDNKRVRRIEARCGSVTTTAEHVVFMADLERTAQTIVPGQRIKETRLPAVPARTSLPAHAAWCLGALVGDESAFVEEGGVGATLARADEWLCAAYADVIPGRTVGTLALRDAPSYLQWLRAECSTADGYKRVPGVVLNGDESIWRAFLAGYHQTDARKAGYPSDQDHNFKTDSPTLALALWWMASRALNRECGLTVEAEAPECPGPFYTINLRDPRRGGEGKHPQTNRREVTRIVEEPHFDGWLYDLTTESGKFHAGVGEITIHNSPRRGKEFVTRKISDGVARIKLGMQEKLHLGNLEAQRDWGFAGDYVRAMWLMLQQEYADDYVIATGRTHSVREFCRLAFGSVGLDYEQYVVEDPRFVRPAEVDLLIGDWTKAKRVLSWGPNVTFEALVEQMVSADVGRLRPLARV